MRNRIKHYRKHLGISQKELAEKVGVSRQTINITEKGTQNPSLELAFNIAHVFHSNIENVFEHHRQQPCQHHYIG